MKKKLIVLIAVLASGVVVDASGRSEANADTVISPRDASGEPAETVMAALRHACSSSSREAAQSWCDLAFSQ